MANPVWVHESDGRFKAGTMKALNNKNKNIYENDFEYKLSNTRLIS